MLYALSSLVFVLGYIILQWAHGYQRFLELTLKDAQKDALPYSLRLAHARIQWEMAKEKYLTLLKEPANQSPVRGRGRYRSPSEAWREAAEVIRAKGAEMKIAEAEAASPLRRVKELEMHAKWWWVPGLTKQPQVLIEMDQQLQSWSP